MNNQFSFGRILVCQPKYFDVTYEINPWMKVSNAPVKSAALEQWKNLHDTLLKVGVSLEYVEPVAQNPDLVFTANAGLLKGKDVVLAKFKHPERQGEEAVFQAWFEAQGYTVKKLQSGCFEGEGDALFAGEKLFLGYGFRTDLSIVNELAKILSVKDLIPCELVDGRYYHLDTCFAPLNETLAMVHKSAFAPESFKLLEKNLDLIVVPEAEATNFVCNAVVLGKNIILPSECPETYKQLQNRGFTTYPVKLDEFLKAGGSAKCLTLYLDR
jgi:N-dimethylarginine dimethylaminohydrolase